MNKDFFLLLLSAILLISVNGMSVDLESSELKPDGKQAGDIISPYGLTLVPINTAVVMGENATMYCKSDTSDTLTWFFVPAGGGTQYFVVIAECTVINPSFVDRIASDHRGFGECNLIVLEAEAQDAGNYACFQPHGGSTDPASGAQLSIITVEPECTTNVTDVFDLEYVEYFCFINYTDNISPILINWLDDSSQPIYDAESVSLPGYTSSRVILQAQPPALKVFRSVTYYGPPVDLVSTANNTPTFQYIWYTPQTPVKHRLMVPENTVAPAGSKVNMTCRRRSQEIAWTFIEKSTTVSKLIVSGCRVIPVYAGTYDVDSEMDACHLIIDPLSTSHQGTYTCQDVFSEDPTTFSASLNIG